MFRSFVRLGPTRRRPNGSVANGPSTSTRSRDLLISCSPVPRQAAVKNQRARKGRAMIT
jgi:hypothetical protein